MANYELNEVTRSKEVMRSNDKKNIKNNIDMLTKEHRTQLA